CSSAVKESEIEYKLEKIKGDWTYCTVSFANYKTKGKLLLDAKQMVTMQGDLEDSQMTLASLLTNRYNHSFKKELSEWYKRLSTVSEVLELWLTVQAMWHYLEVVFTGGDIAKQLPQETKRFAQINKAWSKMMHASAESPNLIRTCYSDASVQQTLPHLNQQLELCQKSLSGYLEMKRNLFPRFFFVSDPSILEILGQGSDPKTIQPHLGSVFDNVTRVTFHRITPGVIIAMSSAEGEEVPLKEQMVCEGNVEDWLAMLERAMIATLRSLMREASRAVRTTELQEFINRFPAQVAFFGLQLQWCQEMEGAMHASRTDKNSVKKADMRVAATLRELVVLSTRELPPMSRTTLETLITQQVHQKDVSQELLLSKVHSVNEFEWTKQTRVYWNSELDGCMLSITDVELEYAYEYIGVQERLVITPLTDRCYITLAKALGLFLGGAPAGPAGTGKTETTKDMGHCLGKFVVVFNCSDQFDHRGMGKIFKGLSQSGAWGCFDEFNIELEVLSVVAQQELPENLKALFRSVAMMVPDRQRIMRVKLAAAGFQTNELFAKKFFVLYGLCEQQLSKQRHYDFGLRNILSVLRALGPALRAAPTQPETTIFLRVLRDMNLSKLSDEDEPLFLSLLNDLFPGEMVAKEKYAELTGAIDVVLEASTPRLVNHPEWNLKVIQLHETAMVRWGIMILGTSCAGKSTCVSTYLKARCHVGQRSTATRMNPKAVTASQMFGLLDAATNDWTDGIFAALWRKACKRQSEDATWLVLDGPVDAVWIENLNTVLDDNRMLTLANGDRIAMAASLKLLFEVANLDNASPATVSRAGIVYMSASSLGWRPVVQAWLQNRCDPRARPGSAPAPASPEVPLLKELFAQHVEPIFEFMHQEALESKMALERVNCIKTCLLLLQALLPASRDPREDDVLEGPAAAQPGVVAGGGSEGDAAEQKQERATFEEHVQRLFVLALAWGVGGLLEPEATMKLDAYFQGSAMSTPAVGAVARTIFEFIVTEEGLWEGWSSRVPAWSYPSQGAMVFSSILVPTVDNVRAAFLLEVVARQRASVLLVGPSGSAKTVTVKSYLAGLPGNHISKTLNFSSATTPLIFQRAVESLLEKRLGNAFGPSGGRRMSVFIDDLNLPAINKWGDQVTSESLRALMEDGGFYSLEKPGEFKHMEDLQFGSIEKIYGGIIAGHYTEERGFPHDVVKLARQLPKVTHTLWQKVRDNMLPTPAKFHYIFNLRDLSRIAQGLTMTDSEVVKSPGMLCRLWLHESSRVLSDKLNAQEDLGWFTYTIGSVLETVSSEATFLKSIQQQESVCFVDFLRDPPEDLPEDGELDDIPKVYELVPSWDELKARLTYYQGVQGPRIKSMVGRGWREGKRLDLVLFQVAIHHLTRISRILRMPRGSALLVGVGGTGKQSLTRLAAFIAGYKLYQLNITREYKTMALFEDLKHMYREAATAREPIVFLCTDADILDESFLEYINMLQVSGEIPNLLAKDEVDAMLNDVRTIIQKDKELSKTFVDTRENLYGRMVERVRDNLHLVLCFSPVGERFRERAERFPGLISGCTMNWFFGWPMDALRSVGTKFLADFPMVCNTTVTDSLIAFQGHVHSTVRDMCAEYFRVYRRHAYVTPKSFLSFMKGYKTMYSRKKRELEDQAQTLRAGMSKLVEGETTVESMTEQLKVKQVDLAKAQAALGTLLADIQNSTTLAETQTIKVEAEKERLKSEAEVVSFQKFEAEKDLEAAQPALEQAAAALKEINQSDIVLLKQLKKPPNLIKRLMDGVLILRHFPLDAGVQIEFISSGPTLQASWKSTQAMLIDTHFLQKLVEFPKQQINDETCELLMPYLTMPDFNVTAARKVSGNVAGICIWVKSMAEYHEIAKIVAPKTLKVAQMQQNMDRANRLLRAAEDELKAKQLELSKMQQKYDDAISRKKQLEDDLELTTRKMNSAHALITALAGEKRRWSEQLSSFEDTLNRLVGDVAVGMAFLAYAGPFNQRQRGALMETLILAIDRHHVPFTATFSLPAFLSNDNEIAEWNLQGLPTDGLSVQNGILVHHALRYPVLIDPQGQGKAWIINREAKNNLKITSFRNKKFRQEVEDALQNGEVMLIAEIEEELDPILNNVLEKNYLKIGKGLKVRMAEREIDVHENFHLYLTSKLPNPRFPPDLFAMCLVTDFTVTAMGLEDQLLGRVINKEKYELEEQRQQLLEDVASNMRKGKQLEESLLIRLSTAQGNLLDDITLIDVLASTKKTAEEIEEKIVTAQTTEQKINLAREEYRAVARRGAILYFLVTEMSRVNHMYQISLVQYLKNFDEAIRDAKPNKIPSKRIANVMERITWVVYRYVARGLFNRHRLVLVLQMAIRIDISQDTVQEEEYDVLVRGGAAQTISAHPNDLSRWLPDQQWLNLVAMTQIPEFQILLTTIATNSNVWKKWYSQEAPEELPFPGGGRMDQLTPFQRLLLVRCLREDRTMLAATQYISASLGREFLEAVPLDLEGAVAESDPRTPLIVVLSAGADPTAALEALAKRTKTALLGVSMGQGQEVIARALMQQGMEQGAWVLLQNGHLSLRFLTELQSILAEMQDPVETHRVWITAEPTDRFPIGLLHLCIKLTNEPPAGLKAGLQRSFQWVDQDMLECVDLNQWPTILYTLCFLHTIVQERRKFGPLGWNVPYEFNQSDLSACVLIMQKYFYSTNAKSSQALLIDWEALHFMLCEVMYGGRITDDFDRRLMNTYGHVYLNESIFSDTFQFAEGWVRAWHALQLPLKDLPSYVALPTDTIPYGSVSVSPSLPYSDLSVAPPSIAPPQATPHPLQATPHPLNDATPPAALTPSSDAAPLSDAAPPPAAAPPSSDAAPPSSDAAPPSSDAAP
ncbi:hypothetical protein CYMTET_27268, partial [Cymbomonas tetramitiformis]